MKTWLVLLSFVFGLIAIGIGIYFYPSDNGALVPYEMAIYNVREAAINDTYESQPDTDAAATIMDRYHNEVLAALKFRPVDDTSPDYLSTILTLYAIATTVGEPRIFQNYESPVFLVYSSLLVVIFGTVMSTMSFVGLCLMHKSYHYRLPVGFRSHLHWKPTVGEGALSGNDAIEACTSHIRQTPHI
ncbi:hypothetical protein L596_009394 [Steinernema carpocapsae]|uniref:Uncharacterized protein n=1 Tax=Steinernema carpocapsae TaxID=34508 RepID=A0A4V6A6K4_STECR|nr:hypothetical protein L596_009394 [Steinernema carpocapsae]